MELTPRPCYYSQHDLYSANASNYMSKTLPLFEPSIGNGVKQVLKTYLTFATIPTPGTDTVPDSTLHPDYIPTSGFTCYARFLVRKNFLLENAYTLSHTTSEVLSQSQARLYESVEI